MPQRNVNAGAVDLSIDVFLEMLEAAKSRTLAEMSEPLLDAELVDAAVLSFLAASLIDPVDDSEET